MDNKVKSLVFTSSSFLLAITVEKALNNAGIKTHTEKNQNGETDVFVEKKSYKTAANLLRVRPKYGELFSYVHSSK